MKLLTQIGRALEGRYGGNRPIYAHYGITHRCNMRCRMCVVWRSADRKAELSAAQVEVLAENLRRAGVVSMALSGGESFLREDLPELTRSFASRDMDVRILTNGVAVTEKQVEAVVAAGALGVSISLDSRDPAKVMDIYNGADVFDSIVETMRLFVRKSPPGAINIMNVVVSRMNLSELPDLVHFARDIGFHCSFVPVAISPSEEESDGFAACVPELAVPPEQFEQLESSYRQLMRMKLRGAPIANSTRFLKDSLEHMKTGAYPWSCDAGQLYLSISPEGGISACHNFPPFARYDVPDLAELLRAPELQALLRGQRESCRGCMRPCWADFTHAIKNTRASLEAFRLALDSIRRR